jgi:hypothetical protein
MPSLKCKNARACKAMEKLEFQALSGEAPSRLFPLYRLVYVTYLPVRRAAADLLRVGCYDGKVTV